MNLSNGMCAVYENGKEKLEHLLIDLWHVHVYGIWDAVETLIKFYIDNSFRSIFKWFWLGIWATNGIKGGKHDTKHCQMNPVEI